MALKISATEITKRHLASVFVNSKNRLSLIDLMIFGGLPLFVAFALSHDVDALANDAINGAIAIFSIFGALLLSVQVALFGISQRDIVKDEDGKKSVIIKNDRSKNRRALIKELNVNISFLNMFSVLSLIILLSFGVLRLPNSMEVFYFGFSVTFFLLNILMTIKRSFILFDEEYS